MDVFDLMAKITLDSSDYESGLNNASQATTSFGSVMGNIGKGAAAVTGVVAAVGTAAVAAGKELYSTVSEVAAAGDEVDKASQKLGVSAELYQELSYAAELSGASIENLKKGVVNITDALAGFTTGESTDASKAIESIGVSFTNMDGSIKDSETVLTESLLALADMEDETARNAAANDIFGKSYQELLPLLNSGSKGIASMMQEAQDYGMVMSDDAVKASAGFDDALTQLSGTFDGVKNNLMGQFLPSITTVMDGISDLLAGNENAGSELASGFSAAVGNLQNLVPRITSMFEALAPTIETVGPQLITGLLNGMVDALPTALETLTTVAGDIADAILDMLPTILENLMTLATDLMTKLGENLPDIISSLVDTILALIDTFLSNADALLGAALTLIEGFATGLIEALPTIIEKLPDIILGIVDFILAAIPQIIQTGITLLTALVDNLPTIIENICTALPKIIEGIITALIDNLPAIISAGVQLFIALIENLPTIITEIVKAVPKIISGIVTALVNSWPRITASGKDLLTKLLTGLTTIGTKISTAVGTIWTNIKEGFEEKLTAITDIGKNLIQGLIDGITNMASSVGDTISGIASSIGDTFKSFFGIASPSKLFKSYGKFIDQGLAIGIEDNADGVSAAMDELTAAANMEVDATAGGLNITGSAAAVTPINNNVTVTIEGELAQLFKALIKENDKYKQTYGASALA